MKNIRSIVYVILIIFLTSLGTIGLINAKTVNDIKPTEPQEDENTIILEDKNASESKYELLVHINTEKECTNDDCEKLVIIKTKTPNAKVLNKKDYANYILIYDEVIKLIDINKRNVEEVDIEYSRLNNYQINLENESEIETENENKKIISISYNSNTTIGYYDYKTNTSIYKEEYKNINKINNYYLNIDENNEIELLDIKGEKLFILEDLNMSFINKITEQNNSIFIEYKDGNNLTLLIYSTEGKLTSRIRGNFNKFTITENEIYAYGLDVLTIYNMNGKVIKVIDLKIYDIKYIYESFVFGIKNRNLVLINLNNNEEKDITEITNKEIIEIDYKLSGQHKSNKNKPGVYITIKDVEEITEFVYDIKTDKIENFSLN